MRYLRRPTQREHADAPFYSGLIATKREPTRTSLLALLPAIRRRFNAFRAHQTNLESVTPSSERMLQHKKLLIWLYEYRPPVAAYLARIIHARSARVCPLCGKPGDPVTYDHILPKERFPEFSIFFPNLVPACWECNHAKGIQFVDGGGERVVIDPYADSFLQREFLQCEIIAPFQSPLFEIMVDDGRIGHANGDLVRRHIDSLKLEPRFQVFADSVYLEFWHGVYMGADTTSLSMAEVEHLLQRDLIRSVNTYGINNWAAAVYRSIQRNANVKEFFLQNAPPRG